MNRDDLLQLVYVRIELWHMTGEFRYLLGLPRLMLDLIKIGRRRRQGVNNGRI